MQKSIFIKLSLVVSLLVVACRTSQPQNRSTTSEILNHHSAYDDSTLTRTLLPVMMPYNRIIDPAGDVVSFGDPDLENHTLDIRPIPNSSLFAVEDRYGIALLDADRKKIVERWTYRDFPDYKDFMSTYSGIQVWQNPEGTHIFWSAANPRSKDSKVFQVMWNGRKLQLETTFDFAPKGDSPMALPNELVISQESGKDYLYVVLNGNNSLEKVAMETQQTLWSVPTGVAPYGMDMVDGHIFVTNWGGEDPGDSTSETAGVPYGKALIDPKTGAINNGSVSVFDATDGKLIKEVQVGLHPNDIVHSPDQKWVYVSNGNSDDVSVIHTQTLEVVNQISVGIAKDQHGFIGDSPNALLLDEQGTTLYVANGLDNALAVVGLNSNRDNGKVMGFIPTEAYPGGIALRNNTLVVTNLEGEGSRINSKEMAHPDPITMAVPEGAFNSHKEKATLSIIPVPNSKELGAYTQKVKDQMLHFRLELAKMAPRQNQPPRPMPERIGEPSVFKHVLYVIKENRTYDQVLGDLPQGDGEPSLCIFGDSITPNQHQLAKDFVLMDNYYASGKCSAEGHQWTDAAMVTDYVEKNVRAWFRSYPHVQNDALVYDQKGFIWNNAADHGRSVRIYGEASMPNIDPKLDWTTIYNNYKAGKPLEFHNTTTISRVAPMLSENYPGSDQLKITDQVRAEAFIKELQEYEKLPGDQFPELSVMALSVDHTAGTRPGMPTPRAMVADNDLALGRIVEALSKSRFWKNTVIFVTEDDSQAGWDHVSAYRTTGFVISPYSRKAERVSTNFNQTSVVRSIEQILGIPPMNLMDATALPMFDCFVGQPSLKPYERVENKIPLNEMNPGLDQLKGKALSYAKKSMKPEYDHIDAGNDDELNRILWFASKGKQRYPVELAGSDVDDDDD